MDFECGGIIRQIYTHVGKKLRTDTNQGVKSNESYMQNKTKNASPFGGPMDHRYDKDINMLLEVLPQI